MEIINTIFKEEIRKKIFCICSMLGCKANAVTGLVIENFWHAFDIKYRKNAHESNTDGAFTKNFFRKNEKLI